jgi:predicted transcriptional regulator
MKAENENILSVLADGQQRPFNAIQVEVSLDSVSLQNDLNLLTGDGLIEQTVAPDDDLYVITAKGLLAFRSFGNEASNRLHASPSSQL